MRTQLPVKILWLTDMHFCEHYGSCSDMSGYKKYFDAFIKNVKSMHTLEYPIDYILLTGDLAQSGSKADYESLWDLFLKPLLDFFLTDINVTIPLVITIPGNHDVNWDKGDFIDEYLNKIRVAEKDYPDQKDFLEKNENKFNSLFEDYSTFVKGLSSKEGGAYSEFFDHSRGAGNTTMVSKSYYEGQLYGYIVDVKKQVVFVLLNSAWYSLGDRFDDRLAEKIVAEPGFEKTPRYIKQKLKEKEFVTEYRSQLSGVHLLELDKLNAMLDDYPDFTIITCMHHPTNWLAWQEYYTYSSAKEHNANKMHWLLEKTDVFITGHEHAPINVESDQINTDTLHLKGGSFISYTAPNKLFEFDHTWFSILGIDPSEGRLTQWRFSIDGRHKFREDDDRKTDLIKRHNKYVFTTTRKETVINYGDSSNYDVTKITNYLKGQGIIQDGNIWLTEMESPFALFNAYKTKSDPAEAFLLAKEEFSYHDLGDDFFDWIVQMAIGQQCAVVRFITLDIFVKLPHAEKHYHDSKSTEEELKSNWTRESDLRNIVQKSDLAFNKFRSRFFTRKVDVPTFKQYQNLRFANHLVPYWVWEKIWL